MPNAQPLVGTSPAIRSLLEDIDCAARSDVKVLITGESGVGKEVVAGLIHHRCRRMRGPFIAFNCAGVPDTLLASELFGHVRGSFTDASSDKRGYLEQANTGTIFMDEVGEMSLQMQALLLRFLESGEIQPVGSDRRRINVDVRVITATNRRLMERIAAKEFRDDLFYRLNVFHIDIPPLRERREDIPVLLDHFFSKFTTRYGVPYPVVEPDAMERLVAYDWPGNVRELRNLAERLLVRSTSAINTASLPREILGAPDSRHATNGFALRSRADELFERMVAGGESFWKAVGDPFLARDLTRDDLRTIVRRGLDLTNGSYKALITRFNLPEDDYKKFLSFLRKYQSHVPIQDFRTAHANLNGAPTERAAGE